MDLLTQTDRHSVPGETTQRLVVPTMAAYDNLMPPNLHVVTEPVAELERLATAEDRYRSVPYELPADHVWTGCPRHRRPSLLAKLLRRIGVVR